MSLPAKQKRYTFADCLTRDEGERMELIGGELFLMAPPSRIHQKICFEIGRQLGNFLAGKPCEVYPAPFDVRLFEQDKDRPEDVDVVVQPDLSVICDRSKPDQYGCKGAPYEEYGPKDLAKVNIFEGCFIELNKVFSIRKE